MHTIVHDMNWYEHIKRNIRVYNMEQVHIKESYSCYPKELNRIFYKICNRYDRSTSI